MPKTVTLSQFCDYVAQQQREMQSTYAEIEEVQRRFNDAHGQALTAWQGAIGKAVPMLLDDAALPGPLAQRLLKVVHEERAKLEQEIASLTDQVEGRRALADETIAKAQAELQALRQANPQLDAEEEAIKAQRAAIQARIQELDGQIKATGLLSVFQRRRLSKARDQAQHDLAAETARLRQVRERWQEDKRRCEASQAELRGRWEATSTEAAQFQSRLDYLQSNLQRLSRENGAARMLAETVGVPDVPEPLQSALRQVVELNRVKAEYEEGLRSVAEALGLLKGLAEGMERFYRSAAKVLEEQRQYNLRQLHLQLADSVLSFNAGWPALRKQVEDDKMLGAQPAEFSRRVRAGLEGHTDDTAIAAMFESMGAALTQATKAWG